MSAPICPHGNYVSTCPLCEGVGDESSPHAPREAPWKQKPEPQPELAVEENPNPLPPLPFPGGQPLDEPMLTLDQPERKEKRLNSPFSFGPPFLEVMRAKLYDCVDLPREVPHQLWRLFVDTTGKTEAEISPHIISGGQLPAPRIFVVEDFRLVYQVRPALWATSLDAAVLRRDVETLKAAMTVRLLVGVRNYYEGPAALLPIDLRARRLCIPAGQQFCVSLESFAAGFTISTVYRWRVYAQLRGELGMEIR